MSKTQIDSEHHTTPGSILTARRDTPFGLPPFDRIAPEHFRPAFDHVLAEHAAAIDAIATDAGAPTFANTIDALERSWRPFSEVSSVFWVLAGAHTNDALEAVERDVSPLLARHNSEVFQNQLLYQRIAALWDARDTLTVNAEQARVLERYHRAFVRAGAALDETARARMAAISERLATLGTAFGQNVLADEKAYTLELEGEDDLAGLPDYARSAAQGAAEERGLAGKYVITLSRSSIEPFLQFSARRDLREKAFKAWTARGESRERDNAPLVAEMVALRAERARLLGFATHAHYRLDDAMAKTPGAARKMLEDVWGPARRGALRDRDRLQDIMRGEGVNAALAAWDWRYYAEKLRKVEYDLDEGQIKPYLQLDRVIEAAFDTASRLFGLSFAPVTDAPTWHPDVRVWAVKRADASHVGLFMGDYFARPSKRSGAWMTSLRDQEKLDGIVTPIIINVMNFSKAEAGEPSLLSFDDARTLFHEFGHGLHGLLSNLTYPTLAGTAVSTDFVELPSQLFEHWLEQPEVLRKFAVHYKTGEPMPEALIARVLKARSFNQGFSTVEYLASAIVDLDFHSLEAADKLDVAHFEKESLDRINMPAEIVMRHRTPHFAHIFSGGGYASAYYSYMWSEMLDADAFAAFRETGDAFDAQTAKRLHDYIYSAGNLRDPVEAYTLFRGSVPKVDGVLAKRGLAEFIGPAD